MNQICKQKMRTELLNFLRTETCIICGLSAGDTFYCRSELLRLGVLQNNECNLHLSFLRKNTCRSCLARLPFLFPENTWNFEQSSLKFKSLFSYREPINHLLLNYKFHHRKDLAEWFARLIYIAWHQYWLKNKNEIVLIPIPLGAKRLRQRGFNQAAEIASLLADFADVKYLPELLIRQRETKRQTETKTRANRIANLKGAFMINPQQIHLLQNEKMKDKTIIIIDDVATTGITLIEAAKLISKENLKVEAMVIATEHELIKPKWMFS